MADLVDASNAASNLLSNAGQDSGSQIQKIGLDVGQKVEDEALKSSDKISTTAQNSTLPNIPTIAQNLGKQKIPASPEKVFQGAKLAGSHFTALGKPAIERGLIGYGDDNAHKPTAEEQKQQLMEAAKSGVEFLGAAAVGSTVGPPLADAKLALSAAQAAGQLGGGLAQGAGSQLLGPPASRRDDQGAAEGKRNVILPPVEILPGAGPYAVEATDKLKELGDKFSGKASGKEAAGAKRFQHNKLRARRFGDQ